MDISVSNTNTYTKQSIEAERMYDNTHPAITGKKRTVFNELAEDNKKNGPLPSNNRLFQQNKAAKKNASKTEKSHLSPQTCVFDANACNLKNSIGCVNYNATQNMVPPNAMNSDKVGLASETANSANWLTSIKLKLTTTSDSTVMLRNDPIFAMFANF